jgi:hydantoinase/carbamoylase family amidase
MSPGPRVDPARVVADLRELDRRTGGPGGARRVAFTEPWRDAREFLGERLAEIGLPFERDAAGNLWAWLEGAREPALAIGSHLDSVPGGGWLDGALGVMAALGVIRAWAAGGAGPPRSLALVDWADEEGARFGRSLFGSSAFAGTLELDEVRDLRDRDGERLADALAAEGIDLDHALDAGRRRDRLGAYLELHIEQGPVLDAEGLRAAAVAGCVGIERHRLRFAGQAAHAGTTPMDRRCDAGLAAAATALAIERLAGRRNGLATTGALELRPGIATAIAGEADLVIDLRHGDAAALEEMLADAVEAANAAAEERGCDLEVDPVWRIDPIAFDRRLVALARGACAEHAGSERVLTSGALHDAAALARVVPAAMMFAPSVGGLSHTPGEDTDEGDLATAIDAFGALVDRALADY